MVIALRKGLVRSYSTPLAQAGNPECVSFAIIGLGPGSIAKQLLHVVASNHLASPASLLIVAIEASHLYDDAANWFGTRPCSAVECGQYRQSFPVVANRRSILLVSNTGWYDSRDQNQFSAAINQVARQCGLFVINATQLYVLRIEHDSNPWRPGNQDESMSVRGKYIRTHYYISSVGGVKEWIWGEQH